LFNGLLRYLYRREVVTNRFLWQAAICRSTPIAICLWTAGSAISSSPSSITRQHPCSNWRTNQPGGDASGSHGRWRDPSASTRGGGRGVMMQRDNLRSMGLCSKAHRVLVQGGAESLNVPDRTDDSPKQTNAQKPIMPEKNHRHSWGLQTSMGSPRASPPSCKSRTNVLNWAQITAYNTRNTQ
jgi:hypothetical protein